MDPRSPANRGWGWGWTRGRSPANRGCRSGTPTPDPRQIGGGGGGWDRGFRALMPLLRGDVYDVVTSLVPSETKSSPAAVGATRSKLPLKGGTWEDTVTSPRLFRRSDVTPDGNPHPPAPTHTHTHTVPLRGRRLALPPARSHVRSRGPPHSRRCQRLRRKALASVQLAVFRFMLCHMRVARAQAGDPHTTDRTSIPSPVMRDLLC